MVTTDKASVLKNKESVEEESRNLLSTLVKPKTTMRSHENVRSAALNKNVNFMAQSGSPDQFSNVDAVNEEKDQMEL